MLEIGIQICIITSNINKILTRGGGYGRRSRVRCRGRRITVVILGITDAATDRCAIVILDKNEEYEAQDRVLHLGCDVHYSQVRKNIKKNLFRLPSPFSAPTQLHVL